ncbi:hypothetical protein HR12_18880 [Microbacterium sp. SUBG005]|nr:hypothetical protein HR12_18880 [Microbacterium sp. SUBG005]
MSTVVTGTGEGGRLPRMSDPDRLPVPDPAAQKTDRDDTSIVPDMEADPAEDEARRTEGLDDPA